jgi:tetratricopeptide (TPR) repeat protein
MELYGEHRVLGEAESLVRQAQDRAMAGDHNSAINFLMKAIDRNPRYSEAYTLLGNCQDCLDKNDDAIASYNKALQIDPGDAETWFNKGMSLKKTGQINEAAQCFEKCMDLNFR